jgi:hypothetical protein
MKSFLQSKKFQAPPMTLRKTREPINRTLHEKFCSVENHNPNKLNEPVKVSEDDLA